MIETYEHWLAGPPKEKSDDSPEYSQGERMLALLRVLGLFDRPADGACLDALRVEPAIAGLTEPLAELDRDAWNITCRRLEELGLLTIVPASPDPASTPSLDAHPLIREYFAAQLKPDPAPPAGVAAARHAPRPPDLDAPDSAWTEGHRRVYEHLCENTEHRPATIEGLAPLYQAVAHGCHAGLHEKANHDIYVDRILRGTGTDGLYSSRKLGAIGADLGAVACFFDRPWNRPSPHLSPADQAWLLAVAAFNLRALGRLTEAAEPMRATLKINVDAEEWKNSAVVAGNLSELELTLGEVSAAVANGEQSVTFADRSGDEFQRINQRHKHADALHQASRGSGFQPEDSSQPDKWHGLPAREDPGKQHGLEGRATTGSQHGLEGVPRPVNCSPRRKPCRPGGSRSIPGSTRCRAFGIATCCCLARSVLPGKAAVARASSPWRGMFMGWKPMPRGCGAALTCLT